MCNSNVISTKVLSEYQYIILLFIFNLDTQQAVTGNLNFIFSQNVLLYNIEMRWLKFLDHLWMLLLKQREYSRTYPRIIRIQKRFGHENRVINPFVRIDAEVSEGIVQNLFLYLELSNDIAIKLCFQLKSDSFDVGYIVTNLCFAFLANQRL